MRVVPGRRLLLALAAAAAGALVALVAGAERAVVGALAGAVLIGLLGAAAADYALSRRAWRRAGARVTRLLPSAFALGAERAVKVAVEVDGNDAWSAELFDHFDPSVVARGLPAPLALLPGKRVELTYPVTPTRRGEVVFEPAELKLRSRLGLCDLLVRIGERETRRVFPDFAQIARYAWLAGDRRLQEIGIKT